MAQFVHRLEITVFINLRKLFAALAVVVLLAPTVGTVCASAAPGHCDARQHACCDGPRLTQCHCGDGASTPRDSEGAQRTASVSSDNTPVPVEAFLVLATATASSNASVSASPPVVPTSERLSRLATLLI